LYYVREAQIWAYTAQVYSDSFLDQIVSARLGVAVWPLADSPDSVRGLPGTGGCGHPWPPMAKRGGCG